MGNPSLIPGEFYSVYGNFPDSGRKRPELIQPTMYVRDERVSEVSWHVFAGIWEHGMLMRIKVPLTNVVINGNIIASNEPLDTKVLCLPGDERAESVKTFIDESYRLIRNGPQPSTFEQDAYTAAGIHGIINIPQARLRLIIDHLYKDMIYCQRVSSL